ncbi:hypothetical protein CEB3_c03760 [Peptococcaceae bacterium CEB3]|nr:hypothetical protein CEB3_c03760 [Peptococcaceae bacterium CEB3]
MVSGGVAGPVRDLIAQAPDLYYLGAVAHDIPFYDLSTPAGASLERMGNHLHGVNGENTLVPLCDILTESLREPGKDYLLAFCLGMLTHFVTDSTFHPAVYYLSGNYFDPDPVRRNRAVFHHRLLETGLDLWLQTRQPLRYPQSLAGLWRSAGRRGKEALSLLIQRYAPAGDEGSRRHFWRAWRNQRLLQSAFKWSVPWRILRFYRRLGHPGSAKLEALFYPQPLNLSFFETRAAWRHPVSGDLNETQLPDLFVVSVEKAIDLFNKLGARAPQAWADFLRTFPPVSLETGLAYVPVREMKYFLEEDISRSLQKSP